MKRFWLWGKRVICGFLDNNCSMHAAGLTYFALLAIVPILCCILVVAKAAGVDQYAKTQINLRLDAMIANVENAQDDRLIGKLGAAGIMSEEERERKRIAAQEFGRTARDISNALFSRIDGFDVGTLGWIGFGFLLWTIISSLGMVEVSFNQIWGIKKPRPIWKRAYVYLFLMIALPVLAAVAMSLPVLNLVKDVIMATMGATTITKWVSDGIIWLLDSLAFRVAITLAFASLAFAFFFWIVPNCKVRFRPACYGGLLTAVFFGAWMKVCAIAQVGIAKSSALYGSFALLPIVLAWLYMSWQIVLLGANMVYQFEELRK